MQNAEYVAQSLGEPHREGGRSWRTRCPVHGGRSLVLSEGRDGQLLWHCHFGCSQEDVRQALADRGLLEKEERGSRYEFHPPVADTDQRDRLAYAQKIWDEAEPTKGTLVEQYLRTRGYTGPLKKSLRHHPDLWHVPSRTSWPALVAKVVDRDGALIGIHRTWLAHFKPAKAPLGDQAKMALGRVKGGVVRLGRPTAKLLLGEGIETTLCAAQLAGYPGWAVLGAWNYEFVAPSVPTSVQTVIIAADHDEHEQALFSAQMLRRRLIRRGFSCYIVPPPEPGSDWADVAAVSTQR